MANQNPTGTTLSRESFGLTVVVDGSTTTLIRDEDCCDVLTRKTTQLAALAISLYGARYEDFCRLSEEVQQNLLWLVSDLSHEIDLMTRATARESLIKCTNLAWH